jgi:ketosteroid isomerase-like protein
MPDHRFEDEHAIERLLIRWAHARDYDDWDALAACFHDGATIHIAWISGSARDYIARSRAKATRRARGTTSKHIVTGPMIEVAGDRAFSICHASLYVRRAVGGVEVDIESWLRFFDLLQRRNGRWGIVRRTGVYEKDRISPVDPAGFPAGFWDGIDLSQFPPSKRFLSFAQVKNGGTPGGDFVSVHSDEEATLHDEGRRWIANR